MNLESEQSDNHHLERQALELWSSSAELSLIPLLSTKDLQYSESLLIQLLVDAVVVKEAIRHEAATDNKQTCNSHGRAARYELNLLACWELWHV